jgi:hypothetical protein
MGRNEIRLREQLSTGNIQRHRDYRVLMKQHRKSKLFRQTVRFFLYSLVVTFIVLLLITLSFYVIQMKKNQEEQKMQERVRTS